MTPKKTSATALPPEDVPVTAADGSSDRGGPALGASDETDDESPGKATVSNKAGRKVAEEDDGDDDEKNSNDPKVKAKKAVFAAAQKAANKRDLPGAIKALEKGLAESPDDLDFLINLVKLYSATAENEDGKIDYSKFRKAAGYFRTALKAHPELNSSDDIKQFAIQVFYMEVVALAKTKQPAEALKSLGTAIEFGFHNFAQIEKDDDLESVRALPEFAEFLAKARKREVDQAFATTEPFDFNFELTDIDGKSIAKADFKGQVLVVDIWGTWCPPCRVEIPYFVELQKKYKDAGLVIVGLNSEMGDPDENLEQVKDFHKEHKMNYRCALSDRDTIDQIPKFKYFPTTVFLDRTGKVRAKAEGLHEFEMLEAIVTRLLEEKPEVDAGT